MQSLTQLYRIGRGPSSSHTMGPQFAAEKMKTLYPHAERFEVTLYGSLALTGKGHGTDAVLVKTFAPTPCTVHFDKKTPCPVHPNTLDIVAIADETPCKTHRFYSVGGGAIVEDGATLSALPSIYPLHTLAEITAECKKQGIRLWQYVEQREGAEIWEYLATVWQAMQRAVRHGLNKTGTLPGILKTNRRAHDLLQAKENETPQTKQNRLVCAYAFAVSEQNASFGQIVTAPTCGSCGVLPSVLTYLQETEGFSDEQILHALATAGLIGNIIKTNASISGAECGCQAEIGSACSMAAAAISELYGRNFEQIDYAAEVAMEHHLGLTCDPIAGLVQIPCIERNAVAAMRAINAASLAEFLSDSRKISFDLVVETMYNTGKDLLSTYRETASGGLAKFYPVEKGDL